MKPTTLLLSLFIAICYLSSLHAGDEDVSFWLTCPDNVTLDCKDNLNDLSIYGNAQYYTNYVIYDAGEPTVEYFLNGCNIGTIKRTWTVEDEYLNVYTCTQLITVTGPAGQELDVTWPESGISVEGCNPDYSPNVTGYPSYINTNPCALIGVNYEDTEFIFGPQCTKIKRTWTIIDWCTYNQDLGTGEYIFNQIIKVSEDTPPQYDALDTIFVGTHNCVDAFIDISEISLPPSSCGGDFSFTHNSPFADEDGSNASGTYPIGTHTFSYVVDYSCSLKKFVYQTIVVDDTSAPLPYCISKIATTLCGVDTNGDGVIDDGKVEIWAEDFNVGSTNTCASGNLQFSFSPDVTNTHQMFTCADVGENILNMYVTDQLGNQSYCIVTLDIQNNSLDIPGCYGTLSANENHDYTVSGRLTSFSGSMDEFAQVKIKTSDIDTFGILTVDTTFVETVIDSILLDDDTYNYVINIDTLTNNIVDTLVGHEETITDLDIQGEYSISHMELMDDYIIEPEINTYDPNLITTRDVEILSQHIWGEYVITDKFALLAADINEDGEVDATDFYDLMYVLRFDEYPPHIEKPWRTFNVSHYLMTGETMPMIYLEEFDSSVSNNDFFAVMKGDLTAHIDIEDVGVYDEASDVSTSENRVRYRSTIDSEFDVYPNPFSDELNIYLHSEVAETGIIEVINMVGKVVFRQSIDLSKGANAYQINGQRIEQDGMYLINIKAPSQQQTKPITVVKQ